MTYYCKIVKKLFCKIVKKLVCINEHVKFVKLSKSCFVIQYTSSENWVYLGNTDNDVMIIYGCMPIVNTFKYLIPLEFG